MQGLLTGLSILPTSTWADSDPVYLGPTAGTITPTKQYAPNHLVYLGFVTSASNGSAGRLYVRVQNGYEMDELHNVQARTPSLNDTLYYDNAVSPAQWKTASIATILGYTPANNSNVVHTSGNESIAGVKTFSSNVAMSSGTTITPPTGSGTDKVGVIVSGTNTNGGASYVDFLRATNTTSGATNINKYFRLNSTGQLEIVNSAYSAIIMTLTDAGLLNGASATEMSYLSGVTSSIQTQLNTKISTSKTFLIGNHGGGTVAIADTTYGGFVNNGLVIASQAFQVRTVMPEACTLRNWSVYIGAQPATGSLVFTMRLNLVDTSYVVTIIAGSTTGVYQNTIDSLSVPAQGILEYKITNNASSPSGTIVSVSVTAEI